jgi:hypothetical protein
VHFWSKRKLLSCLVSTRGIEANPEKIDAILSMEPPASRKLAQRLAGRLATLNKLISRSAERGLPFFEVLKNMNPFSWGPTQQKAFDDLKDYLHNLTTLASPHPVNHSCSMWQPRPIVSTVLVREREDEH